MPRHSARSLHIAAAFTLFAVTGQLRHNLAVLPIVTHAMADLRINH
jgi:hypothetical protein